MPTSICVSCARPMDRPNASALFCYECAGQRDKEQGRAIRCVYSAIKRGDLPPATGRTCVDCGKPASSYDHRDYMFPLMVEPVCSKCNAARGPALDSQMRAPPKQAA